MKDIYINLHREIDIIDIAKEDGEKAKALF